jgi:hypothetical protein
MNAPALFTEQRIDALVALTVAVYLRAPVVKARFRHPTMPRTTVPEAAIDENGESLFAED